jgi:hypothetical protein
VQKRSSKKVSVRRYELVSLFAIFGLFGWSC